MTKVWLAPVEGPAAEAGAGIGAPSLGCVDPMTMRGVGRTAEAEDGVVSVMDADVIILTEVGGAAPWATATEEGMVGRTTVVAG